MSNNSKAPSFVILLSFVAFLVLIVGVGAILLSTDSLKTKGEELQHSFADPTISFNETDTENSDSTEDSTIDIVLDEESILDKDSLLDSVMTGDTDNILDTDNLVADGSDEDTYTIGNSSNSNTSEENDLTTDNTDTTQVVRTTEVEQVKPEPIQEPTPTVRTEPSYRDVARTLYWVQVGSFPTSIQAEEVNKQLDSSGIAGIIQSKEVNGKLWYRVRVGSFHNRTEALLYQTQLEGLSFIGETVIYESKVTERVEI